MNKGSKAILMKTLIGVTNNFPISIIKNKCKQKIHNNDNMKSQQMVLFLICLKIEGWGSEYFSEVPSV